MSIKYYNFTKYKAGTIVKGVPRKMYWEGVSISRDALRYEVLDVIIEDGDIGYMPASDNMEYYDENFPEYKRIQYNGKIIIGGKLL